MSPVSLWGEEIRLYFSFNAFCVISLTPCCLVNTVLGGFECAFLSVCFVLYIWLPVTVWGKRIWLYFSLNAFCFIPLTPCCLIDTLLGGFDCTFFSIRLVLYITALPVAPCHCVGIRIRLYFSFNACIYRSLTPCCPAVSVFGWDLILLFLRWVLVYFLDSMLLCCCCEGR